MDCDKLFVESHVTFPNDSSQNNLNYMIFFRFFLAVL